MGRHAQACNGFSAQVSVIRSGYAAQDPAWSGLFGAPWGVRLTVRVLSLQYSAVARPLRALSTVLCWVGTSPAALRLEQSWAYWIPQAAHLLARLIATAKSCAEE